MNDILKCYVSGRAIQGQQNVGVVSFAVPEMGILFRCSASGSRADLEFIAFLSFLRFAEHNQELFKKRELHIFTDFPILMYLMNNNVQPGLEGSAVLKEASRAAKYVTYKVKWIEERMNRAAGPASDIPDMPADVKIKIKTFANLNLQKPPADLGGNSKL
jgi:hypothetical protein